MAGFCGPKDILTVIMVLSMLTAVFTSLPATILASEEDVEYVSGPVEIVFSFDTTGSMYSVLRQVREVVAEMIHRLQSDIPGIRMGVIAHGDYQDQYCTKHVDLTSDAEALRKFVMEVDSTGGGDAPEAYEEVLRMTASELSWTPNSQRALVLIGDDKPHEPSYPENQRNTDWRQESRKLANMDVKVYSIKALMRNTEYFYSTVANITGGYYLHLNDFDNIFDFIMAISYREYGLEYLQAYEEEVELRLGNVPVELQRLFQTLKQTAGHVKVTPSGKKVKRIPWQPLSTLPPATVRPKVPKYIDVQLLKIRSDIAYRFATTNITTRLANRDDKSQEAIFNVQLPKNAFISNFTMFIDGKKYPGEVKEKHAAKVQYDKARQEGQSAGHITAVPRNTNSFKVAVNVASGEKVTFELLYQELLERRLGIYEHMIHVDPGQAVSDFSIDVNIHESHNISHLRVPPIRNDIMNLATVYEDNPMVAIERKSPKKAKIVFTPSMEEQEAMSEEGVRGQFIVQYDVTRTQDGGEIEVVDGYFVHFLAPEGLPATNKNIMFTLDMSGSMTGTKMRQLKDAMNTILDQLQPGDYFNVMGFSSMFRYWDKENLRLASKENIADAKEWVENMITIGGTYISGALERGLDLLNAHYNKTSSPQAATMLVFLTDGQPTVGERDPDKLLELVRTQLNPNKLTIFSLGFGNDSDFPFLKELSSQAQGFARKIYADSDAALQLQDFFREIASPVLSDVNVTYLGPLVNTSTLTTTTFKHFFNGTEMVICSMIDDFFLPELISESQGALQLPEPQHLRAEVSAVSAEGEWTSTLVVDVDEADDDRPSSAGIVNNMERMWAYLSIKELLDKVLETPDKEQKEQLKQKALELSLKYHFVTSVTSMVVTKPDEENAEEGIEDPDEKRPEIHVKKATKSKVSSSRSPDLPEGHGYAGEYIIDSDSEMHFPMYPDRHLERFPHYKSYGPEGIPGPPARGEIFTHSLLPVFPLRPPRRHHMMPTVRRKTTTTTAREEAPTTTTVSEKYITTTDVPEEGAAEPQFAVQVRGSYDPICFNANGRPGDMVQLLHDPKLNLTVNAILIGRPYMVIAERPVTFVGAISIIQNSVERVHFDPQDVKVDGHKKKWNDRKWNVKVEALQVSFVKSHKYKQTVKVTFGRNIHFWIIRHSVEATTATEALGQVDHLGFYVKKDKGLSKQSNGILGQFRKLVVKVADRNSSRTNVTFHEGKNLYLDAEATHNSDMMSSLRIPCWQVNDGWSILKGTIENYVIPSRRYPSLAPGLKASEITRNKSRHHLRNGRNRHGSLRML